MIPAADEIMTMAEATALLRVSRPTLLKAAIEQRIGHRIGRQWRFLRSDLMRLADGLRPYRRAGAPDQGLLDKIARLEARVEELERARRTTMPFGPYTSPAIWPQPTITCSGGVRLLQDDQERTA